MSTALGWRVLNVKSAFFFKRSQWFSFLREPQIAFNQRIEFCLDLHNHSVKVKNFTQVPRLLILDLPGDEVPSKVLQQGA